MHRELWQEVDNTPHCLGSCGAEVEYVHVYGHAGDVDNERADCLAAIAVRMRSDYSAFRCVTCEEGFDTQVGLAVHFCDVHLGRDKMQETEVLQWEEDENGFLKCPMCDRDFRGRYAVEQHYQAKHVD